MVSEKTRLPSQEKAKKQIRNRQTPKLQNRLFRR